MARTIIAVGLTLLGGLLLPAQDNGGMQVFGGAAIQEIYRIRLDRGALLLESIQNTIREHGIQDGAVLTAAGSLSECTYHRVKSLAAKAEDEYLTVKAPMEILNINGLIAAGEPHLHLTLSSADKGAFGGHLENGCRVLYRAEVTIAKFSGTALARKPNKDGIPMLQIASSAGAQDSTGRPEPTNWTAAQDHQNMMDQLGIKALRPGPSGNEKAPDHANYDEAKANPFPDLPDPLRLKNGQKVTSAEVWWNERRPEIVEDFEREVIGRVPKSVPKVTWSVGNTVHATIASHPVIGQQLVGHVDNSSYPPISVDIQMILVKPADARGPVPVMIMFGRGWMPGEPPPAYMRRPPGSTNNDPPATDQLIADGWGYAFLNQASVQADNGAGLTKGIIGLVNKGEPRKPDDWGALRAWAWGASRALDYLETDRDVDSKHVGIEGVSRFGKAALLTMAFDTRFAAVLIASSGEGGAKLHRRNFGEAVENLTGSGEYHWMAGNFLKYGAAEATFGSKNAGDLPVDAHELIALCAPRLTFISYGSPKGGDPGWLDQQGSFMAAVAAQPVFRLLGAKDIGVPDDYRNAKMPPVETGLLEGQLAWRQHDGGHTDGPNWKHFIPWADRFMHHTAAFREGAASADNR